MQNICIKWLKFVRMILPSVLLMLIVVCSGCAEVATNIAIQAGIKTVIDNAHQGGKDGK